MFGLIAGRGWLVGVAGEPWDLLQPHLCGHKMIVIIPSYYYYCYQSQCQAPTESKPEKNENAATSQQPKQETATAKKRARHKESRTTGHTLSEETVCVYVCVCKNLCFVCLFVYMLQCFVNCFLHKHTQSHRSSSCKFIYTCPDAIINIRQKYLISAPFVYLEPLRSLVTCRHHYRT